MADLKISALTASTTPLAGTEVLPIVQSSTTKQVSVANLTAGRAVSGSSFAVTGSSAPANGFYLSAANTVSLATNTTERWKVDASGNLTSIGTASGNSYSFYNTGSNSGARTIFSFNYSTAAYSGAVVIKAVTEGTFDDSQGIEFYTGGGVKRVTMASGGDVTVNTGNIIQGTAAKGVNFTANTPAAGMSSQLLNWYEEGLFTPTITFNSASVGITYNSAGTRGSYVRIGRQVTVTGLVTLTSKGSSTGDAAIAALPFTMAAGPEVRSAAALFIQTGITFTGTYSGIGINGNNSIFLYSVPTTGAAAALTDANFSNTSIIWFTMTYSV
jgi:hypothetical protein